MPPRDAGELTVCGAMPAWDGDGYSLGRLIHCLALWLSEEPPTWEGGRAHDKVCNTDVTVMTAGPKPSLSGPPEWANDDSGRNLSFFRTGTIEIAVSAAVVAAAGGSLADTLAPGNISKSECCASIIPIPHWQGIWLCQRSQLRLI
jgi:hypothetical protein